MEAALIQKDDTHDYFGLTTLTDRVPEAGLPMSGVLRNVEIGGASPVYRVGKESMETVTLTRAVSKIRFIFCREKPEDSDGLPVAINSIKLDESMIPTKENLFLESGENATAYRVSDFVFGDEKEFLSQTLSDICKSTNPLQYLYRSQVAQEYENLINKGVNDEELTQIGPFYLRESNKQLTGSITYQKDEEDENTVEFKMAEDNEGNYFSRNHTWIVYAYYSKSGLVAVNVLVKEWDNETEKSHSVYNW